MINRTALNWMLATLTRVDKQTLDRIGGSLRKAGMVSVGGRGLNAPNVKPEDAKNIILGLLGTDNASQAAKVVKDISGWQSKDGKIFGEAIVAILSSPDTARKVSSISVFRNFKEATIAWSTFDDITDDYETRPDYEVFTPGGVGVESGMLSIEATLNGNVLSTIVDVLHYVDKNETG